MRSPTHLLRYALPAIALLGLVVASRTFAEPKEGPAAVAEGESVTSAMRVQEMGPLNFFHTTVTMTFEKMDGVAQIIGEMEAAIKEKKITAGGTVIFVYQGAAPDPTKEFELSIGMHVEAGTEGFDKWKVTELPSFKAATVMHSGPVKTISTAYQKIFPEIFAKGLQPTGENREFYLYWEGEESANNIMLVQVGVQ
ncbi:MAG TPA: GyrI-like domain-containing protein [Tepidisphaeraceae bacterium]|nr:GyrI-like domain-containing protein [Tepidisphaeraceae bacterium]